MTCAQDRRATIEAWRDIIATPLGIDYAKLSDAGKATWDWDLQATLKENPTLMVQGARDARRPDDPEPGAETHPAAERHERLGLRWTRMLHGEFNIASGQL